MAITGTTDMGNGLLFVTTDHDPCTEATDAPTGSIILQEGTAHLHTKMDDGSTTNVICLAGTLLEINNQTGTSYTLVLTDGHKYVRCTNAGAITLTVPPNSSVAFPVGAQVTIHQGGAGQVTLTEGEGVTLNGDLKITAQHKGAVLIKVDTNVWDVHGSLEA